MRVICSDICSGKRSDIHSGIRPVICSEIRSEFAPRFAPSLLRDLLRDLLWILLRDFPSMTLIRYVQYCGIQIVIGRLGPEVVSVRTGIETRHHMSGKQIIICVASALFKIHLTYYLCPIRGSRHGRGCGKSVSLDIQIQKVEIKKKSFTQFSNYGDRGAYSLILCLPSTYNCLLLL